MRQHTRRMSRTAAIWAGVALALAASASTWAATSIHAPTTITQPGDYVVTADIDVMAEGAIIINIDASDVHLDLEGHSLTGSEDPAQVGVRVAANRHHVVVTNGTVANVGVGVQLAGNNSFITLERLKLTGSTRVGIRGLQDLSPSALNSVIRENRITGDVGIVLHAVDTEIGNNWIDGVDGIALRGQNLSVVSNVVSTGVLGIGISCSRVTDSVFIDNIIQGSDFGFAGIYLADLRGDGSNNNFLFRNECVGSGIFGICIGPACSGNDLIHNVALGNRFIDLVDFNLPLCLNAWKSNVFGTDNEGAGSEPGCMQ